MKEQDNKQIFSFVLSILCGLRLPMQTKANEIQDLTFNLL